MNNIIGVLGANGKIGRKVTDIFIEKNYKIKCATLNKSTYLERKNIPYQNFDVRDKYALNEFCSDIDLLVGTVGPSNSFSHILLKKAHEEKNPYVDPMGDNLDINNNDNSLIITSCGLMPGFTGILLSNYVGLSNYNDIDVEIVCGGSYTFSKSATMDLDYAKQEKNIGLMKCIKGGEIAFTSCLAPKFYKNYDDNNVIFPFLTKEMSERANALGVKNLNSYIVMPKLMEDVEDNLFIVKITLYKEKSVLGSAYLETRDPDFITAYMIYKCVEIILTKKNKLRGAFSCLDYFEKNNIGFQEIAYELPIDIRSENL